MTNKKPNMPEDEQEEGMSPEEEQIMPEPEEDTGPSVRDLQKELSETRAQAAEFKDGWQRSVADFQNYRRRVEAQQAETYQNAVGNIIKRYLPVMDDLERALAARPEGLAWADGIELIYRKLQSILDSEGLKRIDAEGQMFDPNFHEAIGEEHADGAQSGQVIAVVRNGYMLGDKVIRPAMVRVAR